MKKLGTIVTDTASGLNGMLIIYAQDLSDNKHYLFQPCGLNPENKQPLDSFWLSENRLNGTEDVKVVLPLNILNTHVEDKATGFNGKAVSLQYHLNGCIHIEVKPSGTIQKTGESIKSREFDIRRLKGVAIVELSEKELEVSKIERPSPEYHSSVPFSG